MMEKNTTAGEQETWSDAIEGPEQPPYLLPPSLNPGGFTAFLDLDGTLINASEEKPDKFDYVITAMIAGKPKTYYIQKRPFVDELLDYLGERFEVVLFTAGVQEYASPIVDQLDTKKVISHSLYRDSCTLLPNGNCVKDLSLTGRDLSKVLIVDDHQYSFSLQPKNGIDIWPFSGNLKDEDLRNLIIFFQETKKFADLRQAIMNFAPIGWRKIDWDLYRDLYPLPPATATTSDDASPSSSSYTWLDYLEDPTK